MKGRTSIAGAVVGSLIKSILFAAIVIAIAIALMRVSPLLGSMALLLFSGIMLVRANRKDIPLNVFTALVPGGVALLSYILQLAIAGVTDLAWPLLGVLAGMLPGWLVGRSHRIYVKDRQVFAHRTSGAILLWVIIYLIGQGATLLGLRQILPFAVALGGFSTAIVVVLSVILFRKALTLRAGGAVPTGMAASWAAILAVSAGLVLSIVPPGPASAQVSVGSSLDGLNYVVSSVDKSGLVLSKSAAEQHSQFVNHFFGYTSMPNGSTSSYIEFTSAQPSETSGFGGIGISLAHIPDIGNWSWRAGMESAANEPECQRIAGPPGALIVSCVEPIFHLSIGVDIIVGDWYADIAADPQGENPDAFINWFSNSFAVQVAQAMSNLQYASSGQNGVTNEQSLPDFASGIGSALDQIAALLGGAGYVSQDAINAGMVAGIAQLLAGAGLAAATAAAQAAANAAQAAISAAASVGNTRILEGADAIDWLQNHRFPGGSDNFLDDDGHATNNFTAWLDLTHSSANPTGLLGFAGDLDAHNNPTPDRIAITVLDDDATPVRQAPPVEPFQPEPVEPVPPVEPDPPAPPEPQQPPPETREPPIAPPPQEPTKIEEPVKPDEKDQPEDEKKQPEPVDPCAGLREALRQVEFEVTKLGAEVRRLGEERDTLQRAYDNKWWAAFANFHVDMLSAVVSLNLTRFQPGTIGGHPATSVGLSLVFEAIKHGVNEYFEQNPSAREAVKSGVITGSVATVSEALKAAWEYGLKKAEAFDVASAGRISSDVGLEQQLAHHVAGTIQAFTTSFLAGQELKQEGFELGLLKSRMSVLDQLRTHTGNFLKDAEARRAAAQAALDACEKAHPRGGTT